MLSKAKVLESIKEMPDQISLDDLVERLIFLQKIEKGMSQAAAGKVIPHDEVVRKLKRK